MKSEKKIKKWSRSGDSVAAVRAYRKQFKSVDEILAYKPDRDEKVARTFANKAKKKIAK